MAMSPKISSLLNLEGTCWYWYKLFLCGMEMLLDVGDIIKRVKKLLVMWLWEYSFKKLESRLRDVQYKK